MVYKIYVKCKGILESASGYYIYCNDLLLHQEVQYAKMTGNRMSLLALHKALQLIPINSEIEIYSDLEYVIQVLRPKFRPKANIDAVQGIQALLRTRKLLKKQLLPVKKSIEMQLLNKQVYAELKLHEKKKKYKN